MPHLVTTHLLLENYPETLGESRELIGIVSLDEGFDRAYWFLPNGNSRTRFICSKPEFVLLEGLGFLATKFAGHRSSDEMKNLRRVISSTKAPSKDALESYKNQLLNSINRLTGRYRVSIFAHSDSGIATNSAGLEIANVEVIGR